ncbi:MULTISPECIES: hypothetical protein [Tenacibaculum]|jgi:hypothetical protein|uniref:PBCV-specific basic adaptor domain-containing protein n=1 Tax=Tenacibaculum discolor TaxID=361581 RepID=A0A2G1BQV1_9FLAO|nr:hypothetical protein [Tenacibaculum discolor]MDP2541760.1 hypothetical protein [Tenacibaculum discolor]PHN96229.1 hypothetical protein CSC81_15255 [Tenacibaculum discolor]RLJ99538.1 hypothetical protein C8N27_2205 [Tenacibaculum discolor]BFF37367.1 hypothetical protein BACT7_22290 [Tenacibaculum mesophilum]
MIKRLQIVGLFFISVLLTECSTDTDGIEEQETKTEWKCGVHNGKQLWTGPKGGCYYKNSNGNKTYVDRSECNC